MNGEEKQTYLLRNKPDDVIDESEDWLARQHGVLLDQVQQALDVAWEEGWLADAHSHRHFGLGAQTGRYC